MIAELESPVTLRAAVADGLGATILPASMAREMAESGTIGCRRIVSPVIQAPLTLCESDRLPLSEPAQAVTAILIELARGLADDPSWVPDSGDLGSP